MLRESRQVRDSSSHSLLLMHSQFLFHAWFHPLKMYQGVREGMSLPPMKPLHRVKGSGRIGACPLWSFHAGREGKFFPLKMGKAFANVFLLFSLNSYVIWIIQSFKLLPHLKDLIALLDLNKNKFHWPKDETVEKNPTNQTMQIILAFFIG